MHIATCLFLVSLTFVHDITDSIIIILTIYLQILPLHISIALLRRPVAREGSLGAEESPFLNRRSILCLLKRSTILPKRSTFCPKEPPRRSFWLRASYVATNFQSNNLKLRVWFAKIGCMKYT